MLECLKVYDWKDEEINKAFNSFPHETERNNKIWSLEILTHKFIQSQRDIV